jgi:sulfur-carrier protein
VPTVSFTPALQRFLRVADASVEGATVGAALAAVFAEQPALQGYVLDDQGRVRRHVNIYLNGEPLRDRTRLGDPVGPTDRIYVFQALTGG